MRPNPAVRPRGSKVCGAVVPVLGTSKKIEVGKSKSKSSLVINYIHFYLVCGYHNFKLFHKGWKPALKEDISACDDSAVFAGSVCWAQNQQDQDGLWEVDLRFACFKISEHFFSFCPIERLEKHQQKIGGTEEILKIRPCG